MKKFILLLTLLTIFSGLYSQTFKSPYAIVINSVTETQMKARVITISDKQISISKFIGGVDTQYLVVNRTEEKEYSFDGVCKHYYCTTKDKDPINGYQKAIVIKTDREIILGLFATEIQVEVYHFAIN
jgi:hypothetical protein